MKPLSIAYVISPHGFGHAARASAVMAAVHKQKPSVRFEIFTTIPELFFEESISGPFHCHSFFTDIGLVQKSAFEEDIRKTAEELDRFLPFSRSIVGNLSSTLVRLNCSLVVCDIAAMGIAAAKKAGIPSMLVENFTWDWIYEGYVDRSPQLAPHISYLGKLFKEADFHIQAEPVCRKNSPDMVVPPVSRKMKIQKKDTMKRLGISPGKKAVLVSSGGVPAEYDFYERLKEQRDIVFIIAGVGTTTISNGNIIRLPHHSGHYHPDLVNAVDAVVGKAGYSTLAEIFHAGIPFGYISRPDFREASVLSAFIEQEMTGLEIKEKDFRTGNWVCHLNDLLEKTDKRRPSENGADLIAAFINELITSQ